MSDGAEADRRGRSGSLEADVMAALWAAEGPLTPGEVQASLGRDLAYTTVMTTLVRLCGKGMADRVRSGRAFAYSAVQRVEDHAAQAMSRELDRGTDRAAVLSRFVDRLGPREEQLLRQLLDRAPRQARQ